MTMADTIAVVNGGRVEQLGDPAALYDLPATTFVANFLGQSNLVRGRVVGRTGADLLLDVHGRRLAMPADRAGSTEGAVWVGVRPEKIRLEPAGAACGDADAANVLDGVLADASFVGVSTQYVVVLPWGQEVAVFAQNLTTGSPLRPGDPVRLCWHPRHTFALDAHQDAAAGADRHRQADLPVATSP